MADRYGGRYARPQSPVMYDPARTSLPSNMYASPVHEHHTHSLPTSRREVSINRRSSVSSVGTAGPFTTTTYKVTADPRSSTRSSSRSRGLTLDSQARPTIVTQAPKPQHRPVVHSAAGGKPASPLLKNPYRSSEVEYYTVPATSNKHGDHHRYYHHKRYSATMDNADMHRLANERDTGRLRVNAGREVTYRNTPRARPIYSGSAVRHADTVAADYGDNGYGYTNPRDLVQYDLNNQTAPRHQSRRESYEAGRAPRPNSITSYQEIAGPRVPYDARERGPPSSTRGFDRIQPRGGGWEQPAGGRIPVVAPPPPMEPIQRPARVDPPFEAEPPRRRESLTRRNDRPVSLSHNDPRREPRRDDYYESTDESRRERPHRHERHDDSAEQRGYPSRPERPERIEWTDRRERSDRSPDDRDKTEHKGRQEALATGLSLAGAALGVNTLKKVRSNEDRDEREDLDERRRRRDDDEYDDEPRRRRETRDDRTTVDLSHRDPRERRHRDSDVRPPPAGPPPGYERDAKPEIVDLGGRDPKERHNSREERARDERPRDDRPRDERPREPREERDRDSDPDRRERDRDRPRRHRAESSITAAAIAAPAAALAATAIDFREESSGSDDAVPRSHRETRSRQGHGAAQAFNPKDTMDLRALKEALNKSEASAPKEPAPAQRTPRESVSKDARELADIRSDLNSSTPRGREPSLTSTSNKENRQLRAVSPPRDKAEDKPVKSILRAPREKFPEDPSPIREGVAPLKDAKKDGVPPDARWTKISRKLVNPAALEAGKERFEEREDFVIVLRVLSRDEVQGYAEVTERIRGERFLRKRKKEFPNY